jgi:hypothetical protein
MKQQLQPQLQPMKTIAATAMQNSRTRNRKQIAPRNRSRIPILASDRRRPKVNSPPAVRIPTMLLWPPDAPDGRSPDFEAIAHVDGHPLRATVRIHRSAADDLFAVLQVAPLEVVK